MTRYLVIKIGAIGDVAMASAIVPAIRSRTPDAHITWMCGATVAPLLKVIDGIDELLVVDDKKLLVGSHFNRFVAVLGIWRRLLLRHFDAVCIGHSDPRYRILAWSAKYKVLRQFGMGRNGPIPGRHHSAEYVRLATGEDGPQVSRPSYPALKALPRTFEQVSAQGGAPRIVLAPGGAKNLMRSDFQRRWPTTSYVQLAGFLAERGMHVILVGGPTDADVANAFSGLSVTNLIGRTSLPELLGVLADADVVVSHDTSALHLCRLVNTPQVALYGPTLPFNLFLSDGRSQWIWGGENLSCSPCYDGRDYHPCEDVLCMRNIEPQSVCDAAMQVLSSSQRATTGSA